MHRLCTLAMLVAVSPNPTEPRPQNYMYCASTDAVPATNNAYISNIFLTNQPASALAAEFNVYAESQHYPISFVCQGGPKRITVQQQFDKTVQAFDDRGFNIVQIQRK